MTSNDNSQPKQSSQGSPPDSQMLADETIRLANNGKFKEAEQLREKLMEIDPMNLTLIVSTAETIEEQKLKYLDNDHLARWQELYEDFSPEETNCLFYSLKPATIDTNKLLFAQGKLSDKLFFIESGRVTLFYRKEQQNKPVMQLSRGDILGEDVFFEISVCTLSAVTQSEVSLRYLSRKAVGPWPEEQPGLYEKLADYCRRAGKSHVAAQQKNLDRRTNERYPVKGTATAVILDKEGKKTDSYFRGGLTDISRSGICFEMKCSRQETARALLLRRLHLSLEFDEGQLGLPELQGTIVKLNFHLHNDYSVHVRLDQAIAEDVFSSLPCDWSAGEASA